MYVRKGCRVRAYRYKPYVGTSSPVVLDTNDQESKIGVSFGVSLKMFNRGLLVRLGLCRGFHVFYSSYGLHWS